MNTEIVEKNMNTSNAIEDGKPALLISEEGRTKLPEERTRRRVLFIDRDGTLIKEAPPTYQLDAFAKLEFYPHMFEYLTKIVREFDYELVMVTNQDGLGTPSFPEDSFWPIQNFILKALENEGIIFSKICIDRSFPYENKAYP